MSFKSVLTAGLLAFVAVSLAVAVADVAGLRGPKASTPPPAGTPSGEKLVACYFHTSTRCATCRTIEALAREAVAPQAKAGAVEWRVVNYEEPANRHFAEKFELVSASVVLMRIRDGEVVRWKNLEEVWQLVDERDPFVAYVRKELAAFVEGRP